MTSFMDCGQIIQNFKSQSTFESKRKNYLQSLFKNKSKLYFINLLFTI